MRLMQRLWSAAFAGVGALAAAGLAGCGGLEPVATYEPITDPTQLYLRLALDHKAANLALEAPYDTLQLVAAPLSALDQRIPGLPAPTFTSEDTAAVSVTPEGLVRAKQATDLVRVIAEVRGGDNIRHADTLRVRVTTVAPALQLGSLSIDPVAPDSGIFPMFGNSSFGNIFLNVAGAYPPRGPNAFPVLVPQARSTTGELMPELLISYEALDPDLVPLNDPVSGELIPRSPGRARFVARTTAYGVTKVDTTSYVITLPVVSDVEFGADGFHPTTTRITRGGYVVWLGVVPQPIDVTFDAPTDVASPSAAICDAPSVFGSPPRPYCSTGNIPEFTGGDGGIFQPDGSLTLRMRQFPVSGVYTYRDTHTGRTGTVEVVDPPAH